MLNAPGDDVAFAVVTTPGECKKMDSRNPAAGILAVALKAWKWCMSAEYVQEPACGRDDARCRVGTRVDPARSIGAIPLRKHTYRVACVGLALALVACAPASDSVASQFAATDAASACPIDSFEVFIERFDREIAFQELTTADPLVVERYDTAAEPEPRRVVEDVALADVSWPVMPRLDLVGGSGRTYDIAPAADGRMEVRVRMPDTSDQQRYVFGRSPCWQLQRVVDESI